MKYTKEELENFKNDQMLNNLAKLFGLNLNDVIEEEKKAMNNKFDETKQFTNSIHNILNDMVKEGTLTCEEKTENGITKKYYYPVVEKKEELKKEYVKPSAKTQPFIMNASQLERFITTYSELIEAERKLSYLYGIELHDGESGFGFTSKVNEIIWNFVRIIFGDENADDIADYVFGVSNFDSVESLYNELV